MDRNIVQRQMLGTVMTLRNVNRNKCALLLACALIACTGRYDPYDLVTVEAAIQRNDTNYFEKHENQLNTKIESRRPNYFTYAILAAAESGKFELVEALIARGASNNVADWHGTTLLMSMMQARAEPKTNYVVNEINRGATINTANYYGRTALHYAAESRGPLILEILLSKGADPNVRDWGGNTPLHLVSSSAKALILLKYDADKDLKNDRGETFIETLKRENPAVYRDLSKRSLNPQS